jgi:peroxiredoxin Q/BCP
LSDEDHAVAEAYGAWGEKKNYGRTYEGLIRSTIVVDPGGNVAVAQYNVRATGHVAKLRRDLGLA